MNDHVGGKGFEIVLDQIGQDHRQAEKFPQQFEVASGEFGVGDTDPSVGLGIPLKVHGAGVVSHVVRNRRFDAGWRCPVHGFDATKGCLGGDAKQTELGKGTHNVQILYQEER